MQGAIFDVSCGARGQMATAETLQDLARSHMDVQAKGKGGNTKFTCNYCGKGYTGSLSRQLAHLTGESGKGIAACQNISSEQREGVKIEKLSLERAVGSVVIMTLLQLADRR